MADRLADATSADGSTSTPRSIWLTFEADEIIELKRVTLDQDAQGALDLFERVVVPQARMRAERCGVRLEPADEEATDGGLSR